MGYIKKTLFRMFRCFITSETSGIMGGKEVIIMIKELPAEQIDMVKQKEKTFNPHQRLFLNSLETFITAQETLSKEDMEDFIVRVQSIGAPDFADLLNTLANSPALKIRIPLHVQEDSFSASEFADVCGVSAQLVRRECEKGNIKADRGLKNSWIIPQSELQNPICQRWLRKKQTMWTQIEQAKAELQDSEDFIGNLNNIEEQRKQ